MKCNLKKSIAQSSGFIFPFEYPVVQANYSSQYFGFSWFVVYTRQTWHDAECDYCSNLARGSINLWRALQAGHFYNTRKIRKEHHQRRGTIKNRDSCSGRVLISAIEKLGQRQIKSKNQTGRLRSSCRDPTSTRVGRRRPRYRPRNNTRESSPSPS